MHDNIYHRPADYDLEHEGDDDDIRFYLELLTRLRPRRVLELGSGSGRLTVPMAAHGAVQGFEVVGVELNEQMLAHARQKAERADAGVRQCLTLVSGDMRSWTSDDRFDVALIVCSSITHLLTLSDQIAVWTGTAGHLVDGGRLVVDVALPNLRAFAESMQTPPRALVEVDVDTLDGDGRRLIRYRTTHFDLIDQRAHVHFLYDTFVNDAAAERYVSDFDGHVYFPRELELLFRLTGFRVEAVWGDYTFRRPHNGTRELVMVGQRTPAA